MIATYSIRTYQRCLLKRRWSLGEKNCLNSLGRKWFKACSISSGLVYFLVDIGCIMETTPNRLASVELNFFLLILTLAGILENIFIKQNEIPAPIFNRFKFFTLLRTYLLSYFSQLAQAYRLWSLKIRNSLTILITQSTFSSTLVVLKKIFILEATWW